MRDIDGRDLITGDFLLVFGDVVSNIDLEPILAKHRARRDADKHSIMTMILREDGLHRHHKRSRGRKPIFVIDPKTERCLQYEEVESRKTNNHSISLDPSVVKAHKEIEVRSDLLDCHIDICTPDVLGLWSDNFDYSNLRSSFLHGVLKDYELNGKTIYTHVMNKQYATRVRNLRAYDLVSRDFLGRRSYPLCADSNILPGQNYRFAKGNVYKEDGVSAARTSTLKRKVILGTGTNVGDRSSVADSTVGRNCQISRDAEISGSYIWDDVQIGNGTRIRRAIIASGARIGQNCSIEPGSLISFGAHLADGTKVSGRTHITQANWNDQDSCPQDDSYRARQASVSTSYDPSSDDDSGASSTMGLSDSSRKSQASLSEPSMSEFSESESDLDPLPEMSRRSSFRSDQSHDLAQNRDFHVDATGDILEGLQNGILPENMSLELTSLRMKEDASQHQVRQAVVTAFMRRTSELMHGDGQSDLSAGDAVRQVFTKYLEVLQKTLFDQSQEIKGDQVDLLMLLQRDAVSKPGGDTLLLIIAKELYDLELLEEDGIMQWWEDDRSSHGDMAKARPKMKQFIDFLENAEEESD